jgi:hypothetical protein
MRPYFSLTMDGCVMEDLDGFLREELAAVKSTVEESGGHSSTTWTARVLGVLEEQGILSGEWSVFLAPVEVRVNKALARLDGWSSTPDGSQVDLVITDFRDEQSVDAIDGQDLQKYRDQALRALSLGAKAGGSALAKVLDPSMEEYEAMLQLAGLATKAHRLRVVVLTTRRSRAQSIAVKESDGKDVLVEVVDLARLHQLTSGGKARTELVADFVQMTGAPLSCLCVPGVDDAFDVVMTVIPGEVVFELYRRYGERLLEANVRSFLNATGKVNRGISKTLRERPSRFLWYNNGMVLTADACELEVDEGGVAKLRGLQGVQIVNGGQTTASIYFQRKESRLVDLKPVRVPAKILVFNNRIRNSLGEQEQEQLVDEVSRFANSQNQVKMADLSARHPLHLKLESHSKATFIPREDPFSASALAVVGQVDPDARWFYERAAGSYNTALRLAGSASRKRHLSSKVIPKSRLVTKEDLAKYVFAWRCKPHIVSKGKQGCFTTWMRDLSEGEQDPSPMDFKRYMAMAIIYRRVEEVIKPRFAAWRGNIAPYTVSVLADRLGNRLDLLKVWNQQGLSAELRNLISDWAEVVYAALKESSGDRMLSEWSKKEDCWIAVRAVDYPAPKGSIPEMT